MTPEWEQDARAYEARRAKRIAEYTNKRGDVQATVTLLSSGYYAVRVVDLDTDTTLPAARHFKAEASAIDYALLCVTENPSETDDLPF